MSEDPFRDVRNAYALLHAYHTRARDTILLFVRELCGWDECYHTKFVNGFSNRKRDVLSDTNRWAWDFLPMHTARFTFLPNGADIDRAAKGGLMLSICLATDTSVRGPHDNWDEASEEPRPSEDGESGLVVSLYKVDKLKTDGDPHWVRDIEREAQCVPSNAGYLAEKDHTHDSVTCVEHFIDFNDQIGRAHV